MAVNGLKNAKGQPICGATNRQGNPCTQVMLGPSGRCRYHGGATPRGIANGNFKHGRWSKDLPSSLAVRYKAAARDHDILNLSHEVWLVDTRLGVVLSQVDTGEAGKAWADARKLMNDYKTASGARQFDKAAAAMSQLDTVITGGAAEADRWIEVQNLLESRRRLVESERKRKVELNQMISVEKALGMIGALEGILRERIKDPATLAAIGRDIRIRIVGSARDEPAADDGAVIIDQYQRLPSVSVAGEATS